MYPDSEILFPASCIPELRNARAGDAWATLVDRMVIRSANCLTCAPDSHRANLGCCACSRRTLQGFKDGDDGIHRAVERARKELRAH